MRRPLWIVLLAAGSFAPAAPAQSYSWNVDASGNWSSASNWTPAGGPPNAAGASATFGSSTVTGPRTISLDVNATAGALTLGSPNYLLTPGGGSLTLNNNASASTITGGGFIQINLTVAGNNNLTLTNNSGSGPLVLGGSIAGSGGTITVSASSSYAVVMDGANAYSSATAVAGVLRANQGGGLSANSNLQFTGGVLESLGTANYNLTLGTAAGQVQWSGANSGGFSAYNGTATVSLSGGAPLTFGTTAGFSTGGLRFGSSQSNGLVDFQNAVALGSTNRTIELFYVNSANESTAGGYARMSGVISGSGELRVFGAGVLELTAANTYTGATNLFNGRGIVRAVDGVGLPTASNLRFNGGVFEGLGPTTFTRSIGSGAGQVFWDSGGSGGFSAYNGTMQVRLNGNTSAVAWNFGSVGLTLGSTASNALTDFQNGITLNGAVRSISTIKNPYSAADATRISGVIANGTGTGGLFVGGSGNSVRGTLELTAANTYTGSTQVAGALRATPGVGLPTASNLDFRSGVLEVPGNATFTRTIGTGAGQVQWNAFSGGGGFSAYNGTLNVQLNNNTNSINFGSTNFVGGSQDSLTFGSATANGLVNFQNGLDMGGGSVAIINVNKNPFSGGDYARISGILSNNTPGGSSDLQVNGGVVNNYWRGSGTLELTGANSLGANSLEKISVRGGAVRAAPGVGLGTLTHLSLIGGVFEGLGTTTFTRSVTGPNGGQDGGVDITDGGFSAYNGVMTVRLNNSTAPVASTTFGSFPLVRFGSQTANDLTDFQNGVTTTAPAPLYVRVTDNPFSGSDVARLSGQITGAGGVRVNDPLVASTTSRDYYLNRGTLELTANNTYTGTTVVGGGALRANNGAGLPTTSLLAFAGGVLESQGASPVTFSRVVGTGTGNVVWVGDGGFSAGQANMTVQLNGGTGTVVWGQGGFVPAGATLKFGSGTAAALSDFQNGIDLAGRPRFLAVTDNVFSTADRGRISGVISNGGLEIIAPPSTAFNPLPAGVLELTAANTYALGTGVRAGTLLVNNTSGSGTGSGGVFVDFAATLGGTGRIDGTTTVAGVLKPGSLEAPTGTLTVNNNLALIAGARLLVTISGAVASKLVVNGNLDLSSALDAAQVSGTLDGTTTYVVLTFTGTRTGVLDDITAVAAQGYTVDYSVAGQIRFVPVPEPGVVFGVAAVALAAAAGVRRFRRG